jgi:hypothetical protein
MRVFLVGAFLAEETRLESPGKHTSLRNAAEPRHAGDGGYAMLHPRA